MIYDDLLESEAGLSNQIEDELRRRVTLNEDAYSLQMKIDRVSRALFVLRQNRVELRKAPVIRLAGLRETANAIAEHEYVLGVLTEEMTSLRDRRVALEASLLSLDEQICDVVAEQSEYFQVLDFSSHDSRGEASPG